MHHLLESETRTEELLKRRLMYLVVEYTFSRGYANNPSEAKRLGIAELTSDVSKTAQPFFERFGFVVIEQRKLVIRGVEVPNALMRKSLLEIARFQHGSVAGGR